jgi:hypothetical protein
MGDRGHAIASTARVRAPASEPPGSRSIRIDSTAASSCYKSTLLPALEELEVFCSASLLVDRASGRGMAAATFDSVEAIERNKDQLDRIRATGQPGSTRRGTRPVRLRVDGRTPARWSDRLQVPLRCSADAPRPVLIWPNYVWRRAVSSLLAISRAGCALGFPS